MACDHKHLRCTNGEFFCLDCGQRVAQPEQEEPKPIEAEKPKRTRKGASK